jgi:Ca2+-binding RTX toxin-like protein
VTGDGDDPIRSGADGLYADGGRGNDGLTGGGDDDTLLGGPGNGADTIEGRGGRDDLRGRRGDDLILGGAGRDFLIGSRGTDVFVFGAAADVVTDFALGIDLLEIAADALGLFGALAGDILRDFARLEGGDAVLDFGFGDSLRLSGVSDLAALEGDLLLT